MSDQTRGIIFVVIVIAVTFIWMHYFQPPVPPPHNPTQVAGKPVPGGGSTPVAPAQSAGQTTASAAPATAPKVPVVQATAEKNIIVESALYRVELSNRGGVVRSWKLKKYFDDQKPPRELDLVNADVAGELGWPFSLLLFDQQQESLANSSLYQISAATDHLNAPATI